MDSMDRIDTLDNRNSAKVLAELNTIEEILIFAIAREKASAEYYLRAYKKATTEATKKAFALLLEQEQEHEQIMRDQLAELKKEKDKVRKKRMR